VTHKERRAKEKEAKHKREEDRSNKGRDDLKGSGKLKERHKSLKQPKPALRKRSQGIEPISF
jgi:hypothetical protein